MTLAVARRKRGIVRVRYFRAEQVGLEVSFPLSAESRIAGLSRLSPRDSGTDSDLTHAGDPLGGTPQKSSPGTMIPRRTSPREQRLFG